jgi:hypothetical protein
MSRSVPPAKTVASSLFCASKDDASSIVVGSKKSKLLNVEYSLGANSIYRAAIDMLYRADLND